MFLILYFLWFCFAFGPVEAEYIPINWNISTNLGNSYIEREYNYPMYEDIAPAPCDLTDSCDVFCRQDPDCNESQKLSFPPSEPPTQCDTLLSGFHCGCDEFEKPEWFPLLCYIYKNPIYLGMFYKTPEKVDKYASLKNLISSKRHSLFNNQQTNGRLKSKTNNQFGSPIMTFIPISESFPSVSPLMTKVPLKDSSYTCKSKPVSYGYNQSTVCLTKVTEELCQNGFVLSVLPYLVQGGNQSINSDIPIVLKDLNVLKGIKTEVQVNCVEIKSKTKILKQLNVSYFQENNVKACDDLFESYETVFKDNVCYNVLAFVGYKFRLNGSEIVELKVEYRLTDVPVYDYDKFSDVIPKYIYLKQKFEVTFFDISIKPNDKRNLSEDDELLNRGYFVGEELNFGYKCTENSSVSWEKGFLGVFESGNSCNNSSPITFGFDYFSVCHIGKKFENCSRLRAGIEEKMETLLRGDSLAGYGNMRYPYNGTTPLLRSFLNSSGEVMENSTGCTVPVLQDIRIQYTSVFAVDGRIVHRVLGVRVDRSFKNVSLNVDVELTFRVLFTFVSSAADSRMSRFWHKMFSPESSENSWLYILNAFEDVTPNEREEITFWCIILLLLSITAAAYIKLDVNFGEFYGLIFTLQHLSQQYTAGGWVSPSYQTSRNQRVNCSLNYKLIPLFINFPREEYEV